MMIDKTKYILLDAKPYDIFNNTSISSLTLNISSYDIIWKLLLDKYYPMFNTELDNPYTTFQEAYRQESIRNKCYSDGIIGMSNLVCTYLYSLNDNRLAYVIDNLSKNKIITLFDIDEIIPLTFDGIQYLFDQDLVTSIIYELYPDDIDYINNKINSPMIVYTSNNIVEYPINLDLLFLCRVIYENNDIDITTVDNIYNTITYI